MTQMISLAVYFENKFLEKKQTLFADFEKFLENRNSNLECAFQKIMNLKSNENPDINDFLAEFYELGREHYEEEEKINQGSNNKKIVLFDAFPLEFVKRIIQLFIDNRIYNELLYNEVKKFVYSHWNDEICQDLIKQITDILTETANFSRETYRDIFWCKHPTYKSHCKYYVFWLYCFYPMLDNYEDLILKLVNLVFLDDAQDQLLYGIYDIESKKLLPFYKKFLLTVWKSKNCINDSECFDWRSIGTGALFQNAKICNKLKKELNWDIFTDPDFEEFWKDKDNSYKIDEWKNLFV